MNEMIERGQLPDANINEDDLYGYLQYVTPLTNPTNITATALCTTCNQQIANIFANYYSKSPAPFSLNFSQNLTSTFLNTVLADQYKGQCGVTTLGLPVSTGNDTPGAFQPTNLTATAVKPPSLDNIASSVVLRKSVRLGSLVGALAFVASVLL